MVHSSLLLELVLSCDIHTTILRTLSMSRTESKGQTLLKMDYPVFFVSLIRTMAPSGPMDEITITSIRHDPFYSVSIERQSPCPSARQRSPVGLGTRQPRERVWTGKENKRCCMSIFEEGPERRRNRMRLESNCKKFQYKWRVSSQVWNVKDFT